MTQKLSRRRWIELFGVRDYVDLLRLGYWVVPCQDCTDTVCHGWVLRKIV